MLPRRRGRLLLENRDVPRRRIAGYVGEIHVCVGVAQAIAVVHAHAHAAPDETQLRSLDPYRKH